MMAGDLRLATSEEELSYSADIAGKTDLSHATVPSLWVGLVLQVLVVNNDIYDLVVSQLTEYMGKDAAEKFNSQDFLRQLRDNADHLCQVFHLCKDVIDLTPLLATCRAQLIMLVFVYGATASELRSPYVGAAGEGRMRMTSKYYLKKLLPQLGRCMSIAFG
ncbi:hypothetical protein AK812_SmicGene24946 [Symbiodinium microadriaticum]|uniref:Uncharacterized protein n=1 Tax=Symbiodinium microadriaticum TaxID=2951 RepID=A0A1Q9DDI2_SYMMI|nr:hypothetical protein AK812_SmicGene24946 [Symbiodinium microadriaticum]